MPSLGHSYHVRHPSLTALCGYSTNKSCRSIHSDRTISPLRITSELASTIFKEYEVRSEFLQVLLSFGDEPHHSEASSSKHLHVLTDDGQYVLLYKLNFVEENLRGGQDPWSFRQVGMYHHHKSNFDLFIVIHCTKSTAFYSRLASLTSANEDTPGPSGTLLRTLRQRPESLHSLLLSCYYGNWRLHLRYLGQMFDEINDKAMVDNADRLIQASYPVVQSLRNINDFIHFANACCRNNIAVLDNLAECASFSDSMQLRMRAGGQSLREHLESSSALQDRIENLIELVGYTLTLHNQLETSKLDKEIRDMTQKLQDLTQTTVDDSSIVRLITIVSAIYLPGTFVGGIFGMNFFVFDTEARKIVISHDFWIFILVWLGLSALTGSAFLATWWRKRNITTSSQEEGRKGSGQPAPIKAQ
ncbi:hypothetical protein GQ53DRAFT_650201 [Thozetella sp. PMI_491]|nr:hypothetical protein GQ53DRAFT_650201 [Thozetella sp. PMI_491]